MLNKNSYIIILLGILGFAAFIFLRSYSDYYADSPISESRQQVENKLSTLAPALGFSMDTMAVYTSRKQHLSYFSQLEDTLNRTITPLEMNQKKRHLQSWESMVGRKGTSSEAVVGSTDMFESYGLLKVLFSNQGNLIRLFPNPDKPNPTFVHGDSPKEIAEEVIGEVFGYDLTAYEFDPQNADSNGINSEGQVIEGVINTDESIETPSGLEFKWKIKEEDFSRPSFLSIVLEPEVKEIEEAGIFRTDFGYTINSFVAKDELEPNNLQNTSQSAPQLNISTFAFLGGLILLVIAIFIVGIKNLFKGKVEWKRALVMFTAVGLGVYGWQALFYMSSFIPFFDHTILIITAVNNLIFGVVVGIYMALAYVAWEALARSQNHSQLDVVDALWQKKFFVRETGSGLVHGFAISGLMIGIFAFVIFALGLFYSQNDSQFGFAEAGSKIQLLTMNMSGWTVTWLVVFAQIGFVYGLVHHWISNKWVALIISILTSAVLVSSLGRMVGTSGDFFENYLIFLGVSLITVIAYRSYGVLTVCTAWWVFIMIYSITPYWNSPSIEVAYVSWSQAFIIAGPLIYGLISYKYGVPLSEIGTYVPEYEERMAQHLRVEREIEIARESQYKLMPVKPPQADGLDVHGFFLPSFEVGGDYFDYVLSYNGNGSPKALNMVVVDVSGKAMRAAMPAIFTSGLILSRLKEDSPAQILSEVAEPIFSRTDKRTFITCVIARYNLADKTLTVSNAGHCKPVLKRNGKADFIQTPDPKLPLGVKPDVEYQNLEFKLKKGDFFLLYSDGLPEAANEEGEWFGFEEVPALVERIDTENLSANEIAQEIKRTIQKFSNYQLADDTTVICLKV